MFNRSRRAVNRRRTSNGKGERVQRVFERGKSERFSSRDNRFDRRYMSCAKKNRDVNILHQKRKSPQWLDTAPIALAITRRLEPCMRLGRGRSFQNDVQRRLHFRRKHLCLCRLSDVSGWSVDMVASLLGENWRERRNLDPNLLLLPQFSAFS